MIELTGIRKVLPSPRGGQPLVVLDDVDLRLDDGERVAVVGRSGSGKSSLLALVGLLDEPTAGSYLLDGRDVHALSGRRRDALRAETFGFIFQRFCLLSHLSAVENVEAALVHQGVRRPARRRRALGALDEVGLAARAHHRPGQLSGGEQQRVALARAIAATPRVILADEPTGALDETTAGDVMSLIRKVADDHGTTLVVVTHDSSIAASFDRPVSLTHGRVR
jgi:ABC-type lipoprotein export system ATPase subunit